MLVNSTSTLASFLLTLNLRLMSIESYRLVFLKGNIIRAFLPSLPKTRQRLFDVTLQHLNRNNIWCFDADRPRYLGLGVKS